MKIKSYAQIAKEVVRELYLNGDGRNISSIPKRRQHWIERCCWTTIFGLSLWFCGLSIYNKCSEWEKHPTQFIKNEDFIPFSTIAFPTLTICPRTKVPLKMLDVNHVYRRLMDTNYHLTDFERSRMEALSHICRFHPTIQNKLERNPTNESIYQLLYEMAPTLNETIALCRWRSQILSCAENFQPTFTGMGLCFTFNSLNPRDIYTHEFASEMILQSNGPNISHWHRDTGYSDEDGSSSAYPRRMFNAYLIGGLTVSMRLIKEDMDFTCVDPVHGFDVLLSPPGEVIKTKRFRFRIPPGEEASVTIRPLYYSTSKKAQKFGPEKRGCFYNHERRLQFYKFYAKRNCESECLANYTRIKCGCVKFSLPRDNDTKVCDAKSIQCYEDAEIDIYGGNIIDGLTNNNAKQFREQCNCLYSCSEYCYQFDIDRAKLLNSSMNGYHQSNDVPGKYQYTNLVVNFGSTYVENTVKMSIHTTTDVLSMVGGLLGLLLGLSAISLLRYTVNFVFHFCHLVQHLRSKSAVTPFQRTVRDDKDCKNMCILDVENMY